MVTGSRKSRLRSRVRDITAADLAHQVLGARVSLWRATAATPTSLGSTDESLTSTGATLRVVVTPDARIRAREARLLDDPDGDVILVELDTDAAAVVADIVLYAYGDERTSSAARNRIRDRQVRLR